MTLTFWKLKSITYIVLLAHSGNFVIMIIVSIVIGNLLVALAVSEIGVLTKEAEVIGLEKMALQIVALEDIFITKPNIILIVYQAV